jgi:threonine synthase
MIECLELIYNNIYESLGYYIDEHSAVTFALFLGGNRIWIT